MTDLVEKAAAGDMSVFGAEVPGRGPSDVDIQIGTPIDDPAGEPDIVQPDPDPEPEPSTVADPTKEKVVPAEPDPASETATAVKMIQDVADHLARPATAPNADQVADPNIDSRLSQMEARMQANLEATERAIRAASQPAGAEPQDLNKPIDYDDKDVQRVIGEALADPARAGNAIRKLVEMEAARTLGLEKGTRAEEDKAAKEAYDKNEQQKQIIATGLQSAHQLGDLEAAIVDQAATNWDGSFLGQFLMENPQYALTAQGMVGAVLAVSRIVERAHEQIPEGGEPVVQDPPAPSTQRKLSATPGRATNKTDDNFQPKSGALTPAQEVNQGIRDATERQKKKIPFMFA